VQVRYSILNAFLICYFVCAWCFLMLNITSFERVLNFCNYVVCWRILWHESENLFILYKEPKRRNFGSIVY